MTDDALQQIEDALAGMTPGRWYAADRRLYVSGTHGGAIAQLWDEYAAENAAGIVALRNLTFALVAEVKRLREALQSCPPTSNPAMPPEWHLERINAWWRLTARAALEPQP